MRNFLAYSRYVEAKAAKIYSDEKGQFSTAKILELKKLAIDYRAREWDAQAEIGWRIRNNELPLVLDRKQFEKWKDKYFKDNWIVKSNKLKISYLVGGNIFFDLKRFDGDELNDPVISPLENEQNFAWIHENGTLELIEVLMDNAYTGVGIDRTGFNPFDRTPFWNTGRIIYEHTDSRDVWYLSTDGLCKKIYAVFHREAIDTETLKIQYPAQAKEISESQRAGTGSDIDMRGKTYVWTCHIKHVFSFTKREILDDAQQQRYLYLEEEIQSFMQNLKDQYAGKSSPDEAFSTVLQRFQEVTDIRTQEAFDSFIDSGGHLEDVFRMSTHTIRDDDQCWFQTLITENGVTLPQPTGITTKDGKIETTPIKYIGDRTYYHFLPGIKRNKSAYPFGAAWFNSDMLELKTLLMSTLSILVMKTNKPNLQYEAGSLINEEEFKSGWWRIDVPAIVDPDWRKNNRDIDPYKYKTAPFDKGAFMAIDQIATETIKSQEGAVDALRGVETFSGTSGVKNAQLQNAAATYQKIDEIYIHHYLKDVGQALLNLVVKYRRHKHVMVDYDEDGMTKKVLVNSSPDTMYNADQYYVVPIIEPTPEMQKQVEQQTAEDLFAKGLMPPLDYMKAKGIKNAEKLYQRTQVYQQLQMAAQILEQNPDLIQQYQQQQAANPQPQQQANQ